MGKWCFGDIGVRGSLILEGDQSENKRANLPFPGLAWLRFARNEKFTFSAPLLREVEFPNSVRFIRNLPLRQNY
jgi:hypothetical protein